VTDERKALTFRRFFLQSLDSVIAKLLELATSEANEVVMVPMP